MAATADARTGQASGSDPDTDLDQLNTPDINPDADLDAGGLPPVPEPQGSFDWAEHDKANPWKPHARDPEIMVKVINSFEDFPGVLERLNNNELIRLTLPGNIEKDLRAELRSFIVSLNKRPLADALAELQEKLVDKGGFEEHYKLAEKPQAIVNVSEIYDLRDPKVVNEARAQKFERITEEVARVATATENPPEIRVLTESKKAPLVLSELAQWLGDRPDLKPENLERVKLIKYPVSRTGEVEDLSGYLQNEIQKRRTSNTEGATAPAQPATPAPAPTATEPATPAPAPTATEPATPAPAPTATESETPAPVPNATEPATPAPVPTATESGTPALAPRPATATTEDEEFEAGAGGGQKPALAASATAPGAGTPDPDGSPNPEASNAPKESTAPESGAEPKSVSKMAQELKSDNPDVVIAALKKLEALKISELTALRGCLRQNSPTDVKGYAYSAIDHLVESDSSLKGTLSVLVFSALHLDADYKSRDEGVRVLHNIADVEAITRSVGNRRSGWQCDTVSDIKTSGGKTAISLSGGVKIETTGRVELEKGQLVLFDSKSPTDTLVPVAVATASKALESRATSLQSEILKDLAAEAEGATDKKLKALNELCEYPTPRHTDVIKAVKLLTQDTETDVRQLALEARFAVGGHGASRDVFKRLVAEQDPKIVDSGIELLNQFGSVDGINSALTDAGSQLIARRTFSRNGTVYLQAGAKELPIDRKSGIRAGQFMCVDADDILSPPVTLRAAIEQLQEAANPTGPAPASAPAISDDERLAGQLSSERPNDRLAALEEAKRIQEPLPQFTEALDNILFNRDERTDIKELAYAALSARTADKVAATELLLAAVSLDKNLGPEGSAKAGLRALASVADLEWMDMLLHPGNVRIGRMISCDDSSNLKLDTATGEEPTLLDPEFTPEPGALYAFDPNGSDLAYPLSCVTDTKSQYITHAQDNGLVHIDRSRIEEAEAALPTDTGRRAGEVIYQNDQGYSVVLGSSGVPHFALLDPATMPTGSLVSFIPGPAYIFDPKLIEAASASS